MKKLLSILLCLVVILAFSACKKADTNGVITDSGGVSQQSSQDEASAVTSADDGKEDSDKAEKIEKETTTTPMPSTKKSQAISISKEDAMKLLSSFYGDAYSVSYGEATGEFQEYIVKDKKGNHYATVTVNLENSDAKEVIEHSGEKNTFNLLV